MLESSHAQDLVFVHSCDSSFSTYDFFTICTSRTYFVHFLMVPRSLAWTGFILALSKDSRFSTFRQGPILLLTSFITSSLVRDKKQDPSTPCSGDNDVSAVKNSLLLCSLTHLTRK